MLSIRTIRTDSKNIVAVAEMLVERRLILAICQCAPDTKVVTWWCK